MKKLLLLLGFLMALGAAGSAAGRSAPRGCGVPPGSQLVAQDAVARIVLFNQHRRTSDGTDINREWRYCWRKTGGYHTLVIDGSYSYGSGDIVEVGPVALSGPWAAWTTITIPSEAGFGGPERSGAMSVRDLGTRRTSVAEVADYDTCGFDDLVLSATGTAAWQVDRCRSGANATFSWAVQAENGRTGRSATLDSQPDSPTTEDTFADIQLYQCYAGCTSRGGLFVWWQRNGIWHVAPAP